MYPELERIEALFIKYLRGDLEEAEQSELDGYMEQYPALKKLFEQIQEDPFLQTDLRIFSKMPARFREAADLPPVSAAPAKPKITFKRMRFNPSRAAAVLIVLMVSLAAATYLIRSWNEQPVSGEAINSDYDNDVPSGSNKAVLTLADGRDILLDDSTTGLLASQSSSKIIKPDNGLLVYKPGSGEELREETVYNTIRTPRGGKYTITLPDGSKAWLNSSSSLRFPVRFDSNERVVEAEGEVYFDVAENREKPFRVKLREEVMVEVLGTEFNVSAYEGEQIKATLAVGKVQVSAYGKHVSLLPGQQARLAQAEGDLSVLNVNLLTEIAWKKGFFYFEEAPLETIMKSVARWYDVEVEYRQPIERTFNILMLSRDLPVSRLLKMMELTGHVKFNIEGRRIIVMK